MTKIKTLLVDDHALLRDGLAALLEDTGEFEVVGFAASGREALAQADALRPQLVVMDLAMPDLNGVEATRRLLQAHPKTKVVALTMHADRRYVSGALKAGAAGYVLKEAAFDELIDAATRVMAGTTYLSPKVSDLMVREYVSKQESGLVSVLSSREREVLQLIAEGRSTKEIADDLCISSKTVESHRKRIMDRLELRTVAELTKFAVRWGLTEL